MYKDKKPIKELIKVKSSGLYFHEQQFSNIKDLITWFKEHLKEKEYQKYVKNATQIIQRMKWSYSDFAFIIFYNKPISIRKILYLLIISKLAVIIFSKLLNLYQQKGV